MRSRWEDIAMYGISLLGSALLLQWAIAKMDPNARTIASAAAKRRQLEKQLGRKIPLLEGLEAVIAQEVVDPASLDVGLKDVGGLDSTIKSLTDHIILPLRRPHLYKTTLLQPPKGVLLYGPPGTGKTMLAKALAKDAGATFINIRASSIMSKWFGDSHKLVSAIFTLASKLQPAIIFIDEVDGLLGRRRGEDNEHVTGMKLEFFQLWDGLLTGGRENILVLGATNRPGELDDAVKRRFSYKYEVPLPDEQQREAILLKTLQRHVQEAGTDKDVSWELRHNRTDTSSSSDKRPLQLVAEQTEGFSGSDLFELCSEAATICVRELFENEATRLASDASLNSSGAPRAMELKDLLKAIENRPKPPSSTGANGDAEPWTQDHLAQLLAVMQALGVRVSPNGSSP